jgi:hypothetical protein
LPLLQLRCCWRLRRLFVLIKKIFFRRKNHSKIQQFPTASSKYTSDAFAVLNPAASR